MGMDANGCYVLDAVDFDLFRAIEGMQTTYTNTCRLDNQMGLPKLDEEVSNRVVWFV